MEDFPWKQLDQQTLVQQYAEHHNLNFSETSEMFQESWIKLIYEVDPRLDPNFESSDPTTDID